MDAYELIADGSDCYVHIDKKSRISECDLYSSNNVFFVPDDKRVEVKWASNSMVEATLVLIDTMLLKGKKYDYVCLLCGSDFPIKNFHYRNLFFETNKGCNFIEVISHYECRFKRYNKRLELYFSDFLHKNTILAKVTRKLYFILTGGYSKTISIFKRKNTSGVFFEYGSQWWCLTYECVLWMRQFIKDFVDVKFFDNAITSDECFFQSVFMMSPYKDNRKDCLTYLEWAGRSPRILRLEDYDMLIQQKDKLFARKFDMVIDDEIIAKLQFEGLHNCENLN